MNTNHDALLEALKPFAKLFQSLQADFDGPLPTTFDATISTEDVRRAAYALSQPPAPEQASGELCQGCNGSGTVTLMTGHLGPDDYEYDADCEACHGTGSGDIIDAITALSYQPHTVKSCVQMVDRAAVLRIIKARADLLAATPTAEPAAPVAAKPVGTIGHIGGDGPTLTAALTPILALAAKPEPQAQAGEPEAWGIWLDGEPPHPWREEWFVAETIYGDLVVLQALEQPHSYDYTTADRTYMKAKNVKRWMQFPESEYTSYATKMHREAIAKKDAALQACLVHMLIAYGQNSHDMILTGDELRGLHAAIIQAEEARK